MPKLNETLSLRFNGKTVSGRVIGVDSYSLENFEGKKHRWQSYTLESDQRGVFSRFWLTDWKSLGWILWTACKRQRSLKSLTPFTDRSGIGRIEFHGDKGASTPTAAIMVFSFGKNRYYAMERFADSTVMFFQGRKIEKPKAR